MLGLYSVMLFGVLDDVVPLPTTLLAAIVTCEWSSHSWLARAVDPFTQHLEVNIAFIDISKCN